MNPWPFVIAAYAVTFAGGIALSLWTFTRMRQAERRAEAMKRDR